jgi:TnpA family transposase
MLDRLENPALRRRCQAGLNKGEQWHALTQAICTFRQGRIAGLRLMRRSVGETVAQPYLVAL